MLVNSGILSQTGWRYENAIWNIQTYRADGDRNFGGLRVPRIRGQTYFVSTSAIYS